MLIAMTKRARDAPQQLDSKSSDKTFVSLALVMHFFCVFIVLSSNYAPSALQSRLVDVVAPYTKTLHLDPNYAPFHLISADGTNRLHQWLVISPAGKSFAFPQNQQRIGFQRARLDMFARVGAAHAMTEADAMPAEIARSLVRQIQASQGNATEFSGKYYVRCIQHVGDVGDISPEGLEDQIGFGVNLIYEADVWWAKRAGMLNVLKRIPESRSAPPVMANELP